MCSGSVHPKLRRLRRALLAALTAAPCVWLAGGGLRPAPARAEGELVLPVGETDLGPCPGDPIAPPGAVQKLKPAAPLKGGAIVVDPDEGFATLPEEGGDAP